MSSTISVVINTWNEERNIERVLKSVAWADEIIVCDMHSTDRTVEIAKRFKAKITYHKREEYVETARNFASSKAKNEWILVLDADEEVAKDLAYKIQEIIVTAGVDFVEIPRKNIIFNKWIKNSMWWPDYHIRLFRKGKVIWNNTIHSKPTTEGNGLRLPDKETYSIIHHNYQSISQFINRMNRYSTIQAAQLRDKGVLFKWSDLLEKPLGEFLSRFFAEKGYLDGLHGLALSLLQAASLLVVYLKLWEMTDFKEEDVNIVRFQELKQKAGKDINYWVKNITLSKNPFKRFFQKF